jgi:hypothetical protein
MNARRIKTTRKDNIKTDCREIKWDGVDWIMWHRIETSDGLL